MKKTLLIIVALILTVGCMLTKPPTPTPEAEYLPKMQLLSNTVTQILYNASSLVGDLRFNDFALMTGLEQEAKRMEEVYDTAVSMTPPPKFAEAHSLFLEGVELYLEGLHTAVEAVKTKNADKVKRVGELMEAGEEKMKEVDRRLREMIETPRPTNPAYEALYSAPNKTAL